MVFPFKFQRNREAKRRVDEQNTWPIASRKEAGAAPPAKRRRTVDGNPDGDIKNRHRSIPAMIPL